MSPNQPHRTLQLKQSPNASFPNPLPSWDSPPGTLYYTFKESTTLNGSVYQRDVFDHPSIEIYSKFDSSDALPKNCFDSYEISAQHPFCERLMVNVLPQQNEVDHDFRPHTALRPPPHPVKRAMSASLQLQCLTPVPIVESVAVLPDYSHLFPLNRSSLSSILETSDVVDKLAPQVKLGSYADFIRAVQPIDVKIMGSASRCVHERRNTQVCESEDHSSFLQRRLTAGFPAPRHGQQIMSFNDLEQQMFEKPDYADNQTNQETYKSQSHVHSTGCNAPSSVERPGSLLNSPPVPTIQLQEHEILTLGPDPSEVQLLQGPPAEPPRWQNNFPNSANIAPSSHTGDLEHLPDGPPHNEDALSSVRHTRRAPGPSVAPAIHYPLPGKPGPTRVLGGWRIEGPRGSSLSISQSFSRIASFSDPRKAHFRRRQKRAPHNDDPERRRFVSSLLGCFGGPDLSDVMDTSQPRNSLTPSARVSVQLDRAWKDVDLPERNKGRLHTTTPGA